MGYIRKGKMLRIESAIVFFFYKWIKTDFACSKISSLIIGFAHDTVHQSFEWMTLVDGVVRVAHGVDLFKNSAVFKTILAQLQHRNIVL